jgi:hypothetical protein
LDNPFTAPDIFMAPATGDTLNQTKGTTVWFKAGAGDYTAFDEQAIAAYTIDASALGLGAYVFTPIGEELSNAGETVTTFASPGVFSLTVLAVPEPGTAALMGMGVAVLPLFRRRRPDRIA